MFFSRALKMAQECKEDADDELKKALVEHEQVMFEKDEVQISLHRVVRARNGVAVKSTAYLMAVKDEIEEGDVQAAPA